MNNSRVLGTVLCVGVLILATVPCRAEKSLMVYAEGTGATKDAATQNALRGAIEEHMGIFLSAKSLVENRALIAQEVATYSKGFVKGYRPIEEKAEGGGYRMKLAAELLPEKIIQTFSKQPSIKIAGDLDYINLQLEKERHTAALKIAEHLIPRLIRDGYDISLGKPHYLPAESAGESAGVSIPAEITTRAQTWDDALAILRQISPRDGYRDSLRTQGFTKNGNPETLETITLYPKVCALLKAMEPALLVQVMNKGKNPLFVGMLSLRGLSTTNGGGNYCDLIVFTEAPHTEWAKSKSTPQFSMATSFIGATEEADIKLFAEAKGEVHPANATKEIMERLVPGSASDSQAYPDLIQPRKDIRPLYRVDPFGAHVIWAEHKILVRNTSASAWDECQFSLGDAKGAFWSFPFPPHIAGYTTVALDNIETEPISWEMNCGHCVATDESTPTVSYEQMECSGGKSRGQLGLKVDKATLSKGNFIDEEGKPISAKDVFGKTSSNPGGHGQYPVIQSSPGTEK